MRFVDFLDIRSSDPQDPHSYGPGLQMTLEAREHLEV